MQELFAPITGAVTGSGRIVTESRAIAGVDSVSVGGIGTLLITQDGTESLTLEGEDNLLPLIRTEVQHGRLRIGLDELHPIRPTQPLLFHLHATTLTALDLSGAAGAQAAALTGNQIALRTSGTGQIRIDRLTAGGLTVDISGTGSVQVAGAITAQSVTISGAGHYNAAGLASRQAHITVSGAGGAVVDVAETLDVHISGAGSVTYAGQPVIRRQISGAGRLLRHA